jgi:hypothetical protein
VMAVDLCGRRYQNRRVCEVRNLRGERSKEERDIERFESR